MAMRLPTAEPEKLYTVEEFEKLPEFWERYELIAGKVRAKPVANFEHGNISSNLVFFYRLFDPNREIGVMLSGEITVKIGPKDSPIPDVSFWTKSRIPAKTPGAAPRPDIAVEVWSPKDLKNPGDARRKVARYLDAGVLIVWVVNPKLKGVEVHRPGQTGPELLDSTGELSGENVIPGFKMPVRKLFE